MTFAQKNTTDVNRKLTNLRELIKTLLASFCIFDTNDQLFFSLGILYLLENVEVLTQIAITLYRIV